MAVLQKPIAPPIPKRNRPSGLAQERKSKPAARVPRKIALCAPSRTAHTWLIAAGSLIAIAIVLRLYQLDLRPLHNDEGVNGFFLLRLFRQGVYRYDPANYHGPTLYYIEYVIACIAEWLLGNGLSTFVLRLGPALFGVATILLVLKLRRELGRVGSLTAAALLAISPGAVYFSRDFIHETEFVFFTLAAVVAFRSYQSTRRTGHLLLAAACGALVFATKETAIISMLVLLIAFALTAMHSVWLGPESRAHQVRNRSAAEGKQRWGMLLLTWAAPAVTFLGTIALLYSSFGSNPGGISDALHSFAFWTKTAAKDQRYPWYTYAVWIAREEPFILLLAAAGGVLALRKSASRFALFTALWAFGLLAAYSLVPYKTPWLTLNFVVPMALLGGMTVDSLYCSFRRMAQRRFVVGVVACGIAFTAFQSVELNFIHYDDPAHGYVYVQTRRGFAGLVKTVDQLAARAGTGHETTIAVLSPDYWPLPWELRDYSHVAYWGKNKTVNDTIIITSSAQERLLAPTLATYQRVGSFPSRPGVDLVVFAKREALPPR